MVAARVRWRRSQPTFKRGTPVYKDSLAQNVWRMRQFFDAYRDRPDLSTLLRELPWSANLHVLTKCKSPEEREFYLRTAIAQRWPVREVARQIDGALFERAVLNPPKASTALREIHPGAGAVFRDAYFVEFLDLPDGHGEADPLLDLPAIELLVAGRRPHLPSPVAANRLRNGWTITRHI